MEEDAENGSEGGREDGQEKARQGGRSVGEVRELMLAIEMFSLSRVREREQGDRERAGK